MVNESTRYNGENISLYKLDWSENESIPVQTRYNGVHVSPIRQKHLPEEYATMMQENEVYLFVTGEEYDGVVPFDAVREEHLFHYEDVGDEDVTLLGEEDIGTADLPDEMYAQMVAEVNDRGFNVQSLASAPKEQANTDERAKTPVPGR